MLIAIKNLDNTSQVLQLQAKMKESFLACFTKLKGTTAGNHAAWIKLENDLSVLIHTIYLRSYMQGCDEIGVKPNTMTTLRFKREADERAKQVVQWMRDWTLKSLGIQAAKSIKQKKQKLMGTDRASDAARHETFTAFNTGKFKAWSQDTSIQKSSATSGDHDKDDMCDDNEEDGWIDIGEAFTSGDMMAPYHFGCECENLIRRGK